MWAIVVSLGLFLLTYCGVLVRVSHRVILSVAGAAAMIVLGSWLGFYDAHHAIRHVDFDTITLLLGMMILVELLRAPGVFDAVVLRVAKRTAGRQLWLLVGLGAVTFLVSMMLDNVTTLVIIAPITVSIADLLGISAIPLLMTEVLLANIGGVATLIGDPPNILLGSAAGYGFMDFLARAAPVALLVAIAAVVSLAVIYRRETRTRSEHPDRLAAIDPGRALTDRSAARRILIVFGATLVMLCLPGVLGLPPGLVVLGGACAALLWMRPGFDQVLKRIRWDMLIFLMALFIVSGGVAASGALSSVGFWLARLSIANPYLAVIGVLWATALMSGVVSSIPLAIALIPVLQVAAGEGPMGGLLWWGLVFGLGFGASLTPLGSSANAVIMDVSEAFAARLSFRAWARGGTVVGLVGCVVATIALLLAVRVGLV